MNGILDSYMAVYLPDNWIWGSKGFDGEFEDGEAGRRNALNPQLKLNAEDNLAYAA